MAFSVDTITMPCLSVPLFCPLTTCTPHKFNTCPLHLLSLTLACGDSSPTKFKFHVHFPLCSSFQRMFVRRPVKNFVTCFIFLQRGVNYSLAQTLSWITPCLLSITTLSVYAQPPSISGTRLLRLQPEDAPCAGNRNTHLWLPTKRFPISHESVACLKVPGCRLHVLLIKE
jgi:hypothetical protein